MSSPLLRADFIEQGSIFACSSVYPLSCSGTDPFIENCLVPLLFRRVLLVSVVNGSLDFVIEVEI